MNTNYLILVLAYGRKYYKESDMLKDWINGKDFKIYGGGPYCSTRDTEVLKKDFTVDAIMLFDKNSGITVLV